MHETVWNRPYLPVRVAARLAVVAAAAAAAAVIAVVAAPDAHACVTRGTDDNMACVYPTSPPSASAAEGEVEVRAGDTLSSIAARHHVDGGWRRLFDANDALDHPDRLTAGQTVRIPDESEELEPRDVPSPSGGTSGETAGGDDGSQSGGAAEAPAGPRRVSDETWEALAVCESDVDGTGADWHINTGNGFYGGLQFELRSWRWAGGEQYAAYPHQATRAEQIAVAERLLEIHPAGWGAWPACSAKLGLR